MNLVPLTSEPCYVVTPTLDGYAVRIRVKRNYISNQWFIDVDCAELALSYKGFALVTGNNILHGRGVPELGALILFDLLGDEDPAVDGTGLGDRWKLYYLTRAEVDEL